MSYVSDDNGLRYAFRPVTDGTGKWFAMTHLIETRSFANRTPGIAVGPRQSKPSCYTAGVVRYCPLGMGKKWNKQRIAQKGERWNNCQAGVAPDGKTLCTVYQYSSLVSN